MPEPFLSDLSVSTTTYPDNTQSITTYDAVGRRATSTDRGGRTTTYGYDNAGRLTTTTFADQTSRTTVYDNAGRVYQSIDELNHVTTYGYYDDGRRKTITDALGKVTSFAYDNAGNQTSVADPNSNLVQSVYDELNRQTKVIYPDATFETTEYDTAGNRSARVDQAGVRTEYGYDSLGRLTSVTNKNVNGVDLLTTYGYDEVGNRISQTDANGHTTRFAYDSLGRRSSRTLPLGEMESFTYFADGQLKTRTDFNGHNTAYAYEPLTGRLSTRTPDPFFASELPVSWTYFPTGRRHTMADATGTTSYTYDSRDRLLTKSTPKGSLTYTYDIAGNRKTVLSESGSYTVTYGYDVLNRLSSVTDNATGGGTTNYHYDDGGRMSSYDYPNGISTAFRFDTLNRVQSVSLTKGTTTVANYAYSFYATGNRNTVAELSGRNVTWTYDNLWRLQNETIVGVPVAGSIGYTYDNVGNRLSRNSTVSGVANQSSTYDNNDRILAEGWDPNGNTLIDGSKQYTYDSENRLLALNTSQAGYVYDADGQLVQRTTGGVTTNYLIDDQTPAGYTQIAEERVSSAVTKSYVFGMQRISMRDGAGLHYYGYDAHSGVRLLMNATGAVTDTWDYEAYGSGIRRTGSTDNSFTYRGEQTDSILGLQHLGARWMDPAKGRFATRDRYFATDEVLHPYAYAGGEPIDASDPSGFHPAPSNPLLYGTLVHSLLGIDFVLSSPNERYANSTIWSIAAGPANATNWRQLTGLLLKPDLADKTVHKVWEIKSGYDKETTRPLAKAQLAVYVEMLSILAPPTWFVGDQDYVPIQLTLGPNVIITAEPTDEDGLIWYTVDDQRLRRNVRDIYSVLKAIGVTYILDANSGLDFAY